MTLIHIQPGAKEILATASDDRETRFCFNCRKHQAHYWDLLGGQEYYQPIAVLCCQKCKNDYASFPGQGFDGPRPFSEKIANEFNKQLSQYS